MAIAIYFIKRFERLRLHIHGVEKLISILIIQVFYGKIRGKLRFFK